VPGLSVRHEAGHYVTAFYFGGNAARSAVAAPVTKTAEKMRSPVI
jgi:hypothetical protein